MEEDTHLQATQSQHTLCNNIDISHSQHDLNGHNLCKSWYLWQSLAGRSLISGNMEHELFHQPFPSGASVFSYTGCPNKHLALGSVSTIHSRILYGYKQLHVPIPFLYMQPYAAYITNLLILTLAPSHRTASPQHLKFCGTPGASDAAKEAMPLNSPIPWEHGWMA